MSDITINIKSNNDIDNNIQDIVRPSIDPDNNTCLTDDNTIIYDCIIDPNTNNIKGHTDNNIKALYVYNDNIWLYGKDIGRSNLVSLKDRTVEERKQIVEKAHAKARENRERERSMNDLAKSLLNQEASEEEIAAILGTNRKSLLDNSYASLILAAMVKGASEGSFKCAEFIRDTAGYKPATKSELDISADIITDADRSLIDKALKTS